MTQPTPLTAAENEEMEVFARSHPTAMVSRLWLLLQQTTPDWKDNVIAELRIALRPFANMHDEHDMMEKRLCERFVRRRGGLVAITTSDVDRAHRVLDDVGI